jgi:hypothetical protein
MDDKERYIDLEFGILAVFVVGAFIAGAIAAVRHIFGI